ncbi:hypothetical protein [Pseudarthrobacter albicanus]|uniref:hypothetical protein n=1 Tax=Pseudarthrobacter albicanus TaxID=2823873 RepID=UPI001BAD21E9|nr:hypothetical protein [Pseudarthrobacter albicanus]
MDQGLVGNVLLGTAVWGSHTLPRWAGAAWLAGVVLFYVLGVVLGQATTGSSPPHPDRRGPGHGGGRRLDRVERDAPGPAVAGPCGNRGA